MDGFFAWIESDDPAALAEACAEQDVYLVPLTGGVRIGLCAVPLAQIPQRDAHRQRRAALAGH